MSVNQEDLSANEQTVLKYFFDRRNKEKDHERDSKKRMCGIDWKEVEINSDSEIKGITRPELIEAFESLKSKKLVAGNVSSGSSFWIKGGIRDEGFEAF